MTGGRLQLRILIPAVLITFALNAGAAEQAHHKAKKQEPVVQVPVAPPVPLTPAQMPASPPNVEFASGQLTITAPNSTLGDILREVRKQTGASIEIPGNATERVMGTFGPGPARDVLASLLNGSHFNYVLLGSASDPEALDRVMLLSKSAAEPAGQPTSTAEVHNPQAPAAGAQAGEMEFGGEEPGDGQQDSADIFGSAEDQGNQQQAEDQQQPGQNNPFGQSGNGVKTPDQLLQELQQRQQQQNQQPTPGGLPNPGNPRFGAPMIPGAPPQQPNQ